MGIRDWINNKKEQYNANQTIINEAKNEARIEANKIKTQNEINKKAQLYEEVKQKELYKQTTPKNEQFKEKLNKIGNNIEKVQTKFNKVMPQSNNIGNINTNTLDSSNKLNNNIKNIISQNNTNTPMGNKIFGNSFQGSNKTMIGGFTKENIKKFLK